MLKLDRDNTSKKKMQFLKWLNFLMEKKEGIQTYLAMREKVVA